MLHEWLELRDALIRVMNDHHALCAAPQGDAVAISQVRWQISSISRKRTAWLLKVVNPTAERLAHTIGGVAWLAVQAEMPAYRQQISAFVSRWPIEAVVRDWSGYRHAITELRSEILQRLRTEEMAIRALEAARDAPPVQTLPPIRQAI
jgi:hypothetical protein